MDKLGEETDRRFPDLEDLLPLEVAFATPPRDGRQVGGSMLGQPGDLLSPALPFVLRFKAARDDPHAVPVQVERARQTGSLRWHGV